MIGLWTLLHSFLSYSTVGQPSHPDPNQPTEKGNKCSETREKTPNSIDAHSIRHEPRVKHQLVELRQEGWHRELMIGNQKKTNVSAILPVKERIGACNRGSCDENMSSRFLCYPSTVLSKMPIADSFLYCYRLDTCISKERWPNRLALLLGTLHW